MINKLKEMNLKDATVYIDISLNKYQDTIIQFFRKLYCLL